MLTDHISSSELRFHPHSFADPDGRLFWWNGELYRAISHEKTPFFVQLFRNGTIPELAERGFLIRSDRTALTLEGYGMVLRHRSVPFVSYPHEWCAAMFKDAAAAYLDLLEELLKRGLTLKDTHPWNLLFEAGRPIYVDLTSIRALPENSGPPDYHKFRRYYLYPLVLMSEGQSRIARHLLPDYEGIDDVVFSRLMGRAASQQSIGSRARRWARRLQDRIRKKQKTTRSPYFDYINRLRREIEDIPLPPLNGTLKDHNLLPIEENLLKIVSQLNPDSALALGPNMHWCTTLAERLGIKVVVFDTDSSYITHLHYQARDTRFPVLPLIMDFTDPTPSRGLRSHLSISAAERLKCDLVIALGLVDEAILKRRLRFDQVADALAQFSTRSLILKSMDRVIAWIHFGSTFVR